MVIEEGCVHFYFGLNKDSSKAYIYILENYTRERETRTCVSNGELLDYFPIADMFVHLTSLIVFRFSGSYELLMQRERKEGMSSGNRGLFNERIK